jgi:hypothetical protein
MPAHAPHDEQEEEEQISVLRQAAGRRARGYRRRGVDVRSVAIVEDVVWPSSLVAGHGYVL